MLTQNNPVYNGIGKLHSIESLGALDGPGLRCVVFLQGCPLRCGYCSNRDAIDELHYTTITPQALFEKVIKFQPYFGEDGGVTLSGGDPVYQPEFITEFLHICKQAGVNTALDTSLFTSHAVIDAIIDNTDVFMISLKHFNNQIHKNLTHVSNEPILENLSYLQKKIKERKEKDKPTPKIWYRYVVLPSFTDTHENLSALISFLHENDFELIELLPYHTLGKYKWTELGLNYPMGNLLTPSDASVTSIKQMLQRENFKVVIYE